MAKISVIIPIYNNAAYLPQCLDSLLAQSFHDFEGILVDDGSTDGSATVCDDYQQKDSRLKVFHIQNHGVSYARNYGIEKATGEWIGFVDSDDWITTDFLATLYAHTDKDTDVVMGSLFFNIGEKEIIRSCSKPCISKKDFPSYPLATLVPDCSRTDGLFVSLEILSSACNKLTRRSLLDTYCIRFNEKMFLNEDGLFHLMCYLKAKDFKIIETPLYHYRIRMNSSNYQYLPDVHSQNVIVSEAFSHLVKELPDHIRRDFISLCSYRMYLNTMALYVEHPQNEQTLLNKRLFLKEELDTGLYKVLSIPSHMSPLKKIEMNALKKHWCMMLLALAKIRKLKNKVTLFR